MYQLYGCSMLGTAAPGALVSHWQIAAHGMEEEEDRGTCTGERGHPCYLYAHIGENMLALYMF